MINETQLMQLMQRSLIDKHEEPAFFRALLEATVYAHIPRISTDGVVRFIQFTRPDGLTVLPFFSERTQAEAAASATVTVAILTGRQLFEATRGATLMLNPNDVNCTLYPEEIAALLDTGEVAVVEQVHLDEQQVWIGTPERASAWLIDPLIALYAGLACVEAAYLAEIRSSQDPNKVGLLIALAVPSRDTERAARATTTVIQPRCEGQEIAVDMTAFEPASPPAWLVDAAIAPFYTREWGQRLVPASGALQ